MSYSLSQRADNKAELKTEILANLERQLSGQSAHDFDKAAILATASGFIDAMPEPEANQAIALEIYGHCSGVWQGVSMLKASETSCTVKASLVTK